jgi:hypothetical protein
MYNTNGPWAGQKHVRGGGGGGHAEGWPNQGNLLLKRRPATFVENLNKAGRKKQTSFRLQYVNRLMPSGHFTYHQV